MDERTLAWRLKEYSHRGDPVPLEEVVAKGEPARTQPSERRWFNGRPAFWVVCATCLVLLASLLGLWANIGGDDGLPSPSATPVQAMLDAATWTETGPLPGGAAVETSQVAWVGRDLYAWRTSTGPSNVSVDPGFRWSIDTNEWTPLPTAPLSARAAEVVLGSDMGLLVWGGVTASGEPLSDGAFLPAGPDSDWLQIPASPLTARYSAGAIALDSSSVLITGGETGRPNAADGAAILDLRTLTWKTIAAPPVALSSVALATTNSGVALLGARLNDNNEALDFELLSYDEGLDAWNTEPTPDLAPQSFALFRATPAELVGVDYRRHATAIDLGTFTAHDLPPLPADPLECRVSAAPLTATDWLEGIVHYCGTVLVLGADDNWHDVSPGRRLLNTVGVAVGTAGAAISTGSTVQIWQAPT